MKTSQFINWPMLIIGLFCVFHIACTGKSNNSKETVIIQIESSKFTSGEFAKELLHKIKSFDLVSGRSEAFINQAKQNVVHDYLHEYIVKNWAAKNEIEISKDELDTEFQLIRSQYPDDISFRDSFADENLDMSFWLKKLQIKLLEQKVQKKITEEVQGPTEQELKKYYEDNIARFKEDAAIQVRQIVTENRVEAERLRKLIRKGKDFEDLAKKFSISPDSAEGGNTGWITKGTNEVFDKVFDDRIRSTSSILESPFGHHIIQVTKRRSARQMKFREVKDQIMKELFEDRKQATYTSWIDKQVKSLKVMINEEALAAIKLDIKIQ